MSKSKKMKKKFNFDIVFKIFAIVYFIITTVFCTSIFHLNLLPGKYLLIFSLVELILTVLVLIGLARKHKTNKLNIACLIIAVILCGIYLFATKYINATNDFLGQLFSETKEIEEYYAVVKKDSDYDYISKLTSSDKEIYYFQIEDDVKGDIEIKTGDTLEQKESLLDLGNSLLNDETDAIIISSSQYDMLDDEIESFKDKTKIIYTSKHTINSSDIKDDSSKYSIENKSFNVYISGIDTSGDISNVSRSDSNMIATVNTKTHTILLTSIPRDYYVTLHSKRAKDKLTHSGIYGINETVSTVEDLLDTEINYYFRVNFTTVQKLVDELDGINVYSECNFSAGGYNFKKGYNYIYGDAALAFSRERHSFITGDNQRVKNQQAVIEGVINKVTSSTTILKKYTKILNAMEGCFQTNIDQEDISRIVKDQLDTMSSWKIESYALVGSGSYGPTYSMGSQELYIMIPDSSSVKQATQKINEVLGE